MTTDDTGTDPLTGDEPAWIAEPTVPTDETFPWPADWPWIDVGEGNFLCPQDKALGEDGKPFIEGQTGMWWAHLRPDRKPCGLGRISFEPGYHTLVTADPITITASLLCLGQECKRHGFVTDGKWVGAGDGWVPA